MFAQPPLWFIAIAFLFAIGPLVFIHEMGHYLVARWFGVGAEQFSIGFGREIVGWTDKRGTRWKVGWLPLGGYVRFVGDMNPASQAMADAELSPEQRVVAFHNKSWWKRFLIVLAGPMANFLLAIVMIAVFFATFGMPQTPNRAVLIQPGSTASIAGIRTGDRITAIAGRETATFEDIRRIVSMRPGEVVRIEFVRNGERRSATQKLGEQIERDKFGQTFRTGLLGVYGGRYVLTRLGADALLPAAFNHTVKITRSMMDGLWQIISGRRSVKELGGPLKMAQIAGQQASLGAFEFFQLLALFSINLGFINLLPVPMLDGGHLVFYAAEAVRRKPVSARVQEWAFRGGLAMLLALILFTTANDLDSFGLFERLGRLIG